MFIAYFITEANTIMRMKRPMIEMEVDLKLLKGSHITPLTQSIFSADIPKVIHYFLLAGLHMKFAIFKNYLLLITY